MKRYMFDTCVLIDAGRGIEPTISRIRSWVDGKDEPGICVVQIAELFSGLPQARRRAAEVFIEPLTRWNISYSVARDAGISRYQLARRGVQVSVADSLIAAVARNISAVVVTSNLKDFQSLGVELLNIRG
jgi:predicted nucleic acid-binding protein